MRNAYGEDLAYIHDAGFGMFARQAAPILRDALTTREIKQGLVIDLGCGSGILAQAISKAGYDVLGIDISPAMIALAQKRVPRGQFRAESLLEAELSPCVAVAGVGECFNYLFDRSHSRSKLSRLFQRVYEALVPKGVFLFDVAEPGRVPRGGPRRTFAEGKDWAVLVTTEEDRKRRLLTRQITTFRKIGRDYRRQHEVHQQRLLLRRDLVDELHNIGFSVRILRRYGPLKLGPGHVAFLASRREHS